MNTETMDANLALLIRLRRHLEQADELRKLFDKVIDLARTAPDNELVQASQATAGGIRHA